MNSNTKNPQKGSDKQVRLRLLSNDYMARKIVKRSCVPPLYPLTEKAISK